MVDNKLSEGAPSGPRSRPTGRASKAVSPVPASIPSAVVALAAKPFSVFGMTVAGRQIADAIDMLDDLPDEFTAMDLVPAVLPGATFHQKQEALNRLFQRWRKLGLTEFKRGRWRLTRDAWPALAASAIEARRVETERLDAEHESAVAKPDAQPPSGDPQ